MSPMHITFRRTLSRAHRRFVTAFAVGSFLAVAGVIFAWRLGTADGGALSMPVLWAAGVAPVLPALAALLGMDVWSDERTTGRIDFLLTTAVREREFVLGKFLGVFFQVAAAALLSLIAAVFLLHVFAPAALAGVTAARLFLALAAVCLQGALWSAAAVLASALFRHAATAATATMLALIVLPRGLWFGLSIWSPLGPTAFGEFPLDAHAVDFASGALPLGTVTLYVLLTAVALWLGARTVIAYRLRGCGAAGARGSNGLVMALAALFAVLCVPIFKVVNPVADLAPVATVSLSERTCGILDEASGSMTVTSFMARSNPSARSIERTLRAFKRRAESVGGAHLDLRFVDPRWDVGAAERLVRRGAAENSVVFERGRQFVSVPIASGWGERAFASAIGRLGAAGRLRTLYWTVGHGEARFDDYGRFGMSDIARELFRDGFVSRPLDLAVAKTIPADCSLIVIAGAKDDFSRAEQDRLNAYLRDGGRLLVLLGSAVSGGVAQALPTWGVRPVDRSVEKGATLSGTDVIVSDFADHPICSPLRGSRIILERPVVVDPSALAESVSGVDRIAYVPIAKVGKDAVVAAVERGTGVGDDLALRPMRLVVLGDAGFAINGQLAARACANRDFFHNCVAYLAGVDTAGSGNEMARLFVSGMDRHDRRHFAVGLAAVVPVSVMLLMMIVAGSRRRRK